MSRNDEFFHGTVAHLSPGDVIQPVGDAIRATFRSDTDPRFAYATTDHDNAWDYAEKAFHASDRGTPRVYRVSPVGRHSKDPEVGRDGSRRGNHPTDRRSKSGWKVIEEVPMPENMGRPEDWR